MSPFCEEDYKDAVAKAEYSNKAFYIAGGHKLLFVARPIRDIFQNNQIQTAHDDTNPPPPPPPPSPPHHPTTPRRLLHVDQPFGLSDARRRSQLDEHRPGHQALLPRRTTRSIAIRVRHCCVHEGFTSQEVWSFGARISVRASICCLVCNRTRYRKG